MSQTQRLLPKTVRPDAVRVTYRGQLAGPVHAGHIYDNGNRWENNTVLQAETLVTLAAVYRKQGQHSEAEALSRRALAIDEKHFGPRHPLVADALDGLAEACRATGRVKEAGKLEKRAGAIRAQKDS